VKNSTYKNALSEMTSFMSNGQESDKPTLSERLPVYLKIKVIKHHATGAVQCD